MSDPAILERNLLSVSLSDPALGARIRDTDPSEYFRLISSRSGLPVPALEENGHTHSLHSQIDPEREAIRLVEGYTGGGYFVCFGLGAGYQVKQLLNRSHTSNVLILESDPSLLRATLEAIDLHALLIDPRVSLLVDPEAARLRSHLLASYFPSVCGKLSTVSLRSRTSRAAETFAQMASTVRQTLEELADDFAVQSYFGKRWFANIVANLHLAAGRSVTLPPVRKAWVVAAGPSLERQLVLIKARDKNDTIISTDTAMRPLLAAGIVPDIVLSIDCQQVSYHHFIAGYPQNVPLVIDLASPPIVVRRASQIAFFSSGHPFARYVGERVRHFPLLDTSGGNVTHAAVSLADRLGAREVNIAGADYSYPGGKAYARGTYLYPYFLGQSDRMKPLETHFFSFLVRTNSVTTERTANGLRYSTRPLRVYRDRLEALIGTIDAAVAMLPGDGLTVNTATGNRGTSRIKRTVVRTIFAAGPLSNDWIGFLRNYLTDVRALPEPQLSWGLYDSTLSAEQRLIATTLLPVAAAVRRELSRGAPASDEPDLPQLFRATRQWVESVISRSIRQVNN